MKTMKIRSIMVSSVIEAESHNMNANEDAECKQHNGRSYISANKLRYTLFQTMRGLNTDDNYMICNSDGRLGDITKDIASDMGGYMKTENKSYSNKRTSPMDVAFSFATEDSDYFDDLWVRFKSNPNELDSDSKKHDDQRINTKTYSRNDIFNFNTRLSIPNLSTTENYIYEDGKHVGVVYIKHVTENERKRRAKMFIEAQGGLLGFANQSRNAIENKPTKIFISLDTKEEFVKFFDKTQQEQDKITSELDSRGVKYFIGDDSDSTKMSVYEAINKSIEYIDEAEFVDLSNDLVVEHSELENFIKENY